MFANTLKENTARAHASLEKKLIGRIRSTSTISDYSSLLGLMYGYYYPVEQSIAKFDELLKKRGIQFRPKAANIRTDLAHFQIDDFRPSLNISHPDLHSPAAALGALYVLEGSTLGGQIISTLLAKQLNADPSQGFSFFNPYGDQTRTHWEQFRTALEDTVTDEEKEPVIAAANETFSTFNTWILHNESTVAG